METLLKRPPFWQRLVYLIGLAVFFFASYNYANFLASQHSNLPFWAYDWEASIPLVPWTILPYWSIDLLYGFSLLLPVTTLALNRHALRLLSVQLISVTFFILYPLRFSFDRLPVEGFFGELFDMLMGFDKPFNQAPSLHISLAVVLWSIYHTRTKGVVRLLVAGWFLLIAFSVLTTWQHHIIDVPTGALVGLFCIWAWPLSGPSPLWKQSVTKDKSRRKISAYYLTASITCLLLHILLGWQAWPLGWATLALVLVGYGYAGPGVLVFQKSASGINWPVQLLLFPYTAGAWINSRLWTRHNKSPVLIKDNVYLGRIPLWTDGALSENWSAIVDLAVELPCRKQQASYFSFPVLDLTVPPLEVVQAAVARIEQKPKQGNVLVCCALGYSRSATVVAAWLLHTQRCATIEAALACLQQAQARVVLSPAHLDLLKSFETLSTPTHA